MNNREVTNLTERVEREFLPYVRRPSRYIGGEINQVKKDLADCELRVALCFPDVYEVAMSYTGLAVIYEALNRMEGVAAERVFAPWIDAEEILRQKGIELFSLESKASLKSFDIVGFSLTNELCYTNVLNMLDLGGMKVRSSARSEDAPLVIAGGGM
ncbi:MAG: B12-binding domain-containing radical SAM protein, partial [Planctomycetota bacterium]